MQGVPLLEEGERRPCWCAHIRIDLYNDLSNPDLNAAGMLSREVSGAACDGEMRAWFASDVAAVVDPLTLGWSNETRATPSWFLATMAV